jgi:hypothetical protein
MEKQERQRKPLQIYLDEDTRTDIVIKAKRSGLSGTKVGEAFLKAWNRGELKLKDEWLEAA